MKVQQAQLTQSLAEEPGPMQMLLLGPGLCCRCVCVQSATASAAGCDVIASELDEAWPCQSHHLDACLAVKGSALGMPSSPTLTLLQIGKGASSRSQIEKGASSRRSSAPSDMDSHRIRSSPAAKLSFPLQSCGGGKHP